ncbi:MAG TPA: 3-phosphoshikimate 1-carboxyvinyltransferase [Pyrinomonadaceae bacterium]|nr:3-phosphoshikimate 1-carboxyvinyltransferase [Pyrinomonadaceae bacterium]
MKPTTKHSSKKIQILPAKRLVGTLRLPGDKSISHRAAIIASLAQGRSTLNNFSTAEDCDSTLKCLSALAVKVNRDDSTIVIDGASDSALTRPAAPLDAGNSGTTMRLLAGVLAAQPFSTIITGDSSLLSRPMLRVAEPLRLMGASVETTPAGTAPLKIQGCCLLRAIDYHPPVASAQLKSAVLLAGLFADGRTMITESFPSRDHTERLLKEFGAEVEQQGNTVSVSGRVRLKASQFEIPGDISSAAFFIAAAMLLPGSDLTIEDVGVNPTRTAFISALRSWGADISVTVQQADAAEPVATIHVRGRELDHTRPLVIGGSEVPRVIDELPLLAVVAAVGNCLLEVHDAGELRLKESDRIAVISRNLRAMGADVVEHEDGFSVTGVGRIHGARVQAVADHRIAMALAVAALCSEGPSEIEGAESVAVSFPEFFPLLESLVER